MKWFAVFTLFCFTTLFSCKKDTEPAPNEQGRFVPRDVVVKTKEDFSIEKVFNMINSYDHEVKVISSNVYTSTLPSDSLQYVLSELHKKPYLTETSGWKTGGYLHYQTQIITVFPRLHGMNEKSLQADWLATLAHLKLKENGGNLILLHVPVNEEKVWVDKFKKMSFIDWAELNYYADVVPF